MITFVLPRASSEFRLAHCSGEPPRRRTLLSQTSPFPLLRSTLHCVVDSLEDGVLRGWAFDACSSETLPRFYVISDGQQVAEITCDIRRADVARAGVPSELVGFEHQLPLSLLDGEMHRLDFRDVYRRLIVMRINDQEVASCDLQDLWRPKIQSFVDGLRSGAFEGWALQSQFGSLKMFGDSMIRATCDGDEIGRFHANRYRSDITKHLSGDPYCGFRFIPPAWALKPYPQSFRFYAMPSGEELQNSPIFTSLITNQHEQTVLQLTDIIDSMHMELTRLRRRIGDLLPAPVFALAAYSAWYREYAPTLRLRVLAGRRDDRENPLVSIICPIYRPILSEFEAAVRSVIEQSYENWELLLVDDASADPKLTAVIKRFAASDHRIRPVPQRKNGGISAATNAGLEIAEGEWIAFLDHDDLLADVALETMLAAAQDSQGQLLYCDEDKIDPSGEFVDPAFKTAWNARLLMENNYVCHLLFVAAPRLKQIGKLDSLMDGAQDHDLIFRLTEQLRPEQIIHVPEVLYHWRQSKTSTATDIAAKPYAIEAGLRAVTEHLRRTGRAGTAHSRGAATSYRIDWTLTSTPKVTIIIPYRDEIPTTRRCVETLLRRTTYRNFDIILVDNWSVSDEAKSFADEMGKTDLVRVIRVEEDFNYSRLNNLAAARTAAEFLVFMNNDLFVSDERWLDVLVGEALSDPSVAIVGGKFVYPTRAVQHAGVILGIGGVAGHMGGGLDETETGYCGRIGLAQEYSAVTAAGLLMRASAFHEVGGFDEVALKVAFNDVDICLKARQAGYRIIWTPDFLAEHHESLSRGDDVHPTREGRFFRETEAMKERWGDILTSDPYYNPRFSLDRHAFYELTDPKKTARSPIEFRAGTPRPARLSIDELSDIEQSPAPTPSAHEWAH